MPIKILNLIDSLNAGGAESRLKNLVLEEKKYSEIRTEICTIYSLGIFSKQIKKNDIPVHNLNLKFKYDIRGILKIIRLIRKEKYNIIHVRLFPATLFAAIASFFLSQDIKFICDETNAYNRRRSSKIFKLIDKFIYSRYSKIICVSKQVEISLLKWFHHLKEKTITIPSGIPIPESKNNQYPKTYDVLLVGRLEKAKGIDILLKAINILKFKHQKNLKVAIAGNGPLREDLENLAKELKINSEVEFLGIRTDIDKLMYSTKILVLSSRYEGLPITILEAMSRHLPIVATKVGGIPDIIENKKDGISIPPENPEKLAEAINKLLNDKNLREELAKNAYQKVKENFSIETYTKNLLDLYKSLIKK